MVEDHKYWTRYSRAELRAAWADDRNEAVSPTPDEVTASFFCPDAATAEVWSALYVRFVLANPRSCHYARGVFTVRLGLAVDYGNGCDDVADTLRRAVELFYPNLLEPRDRVIVPSLFAGDEE